MAKKGTTDKNFPTEENIKLFTSKNQISAFFGSFLVLFAIGLLIAMVSFIFYWTTDQDIVYGLGDRSKEVQNLLGKFGAIISHIFILGIEVMNDGGTLFVLALITLVFSSILAIIFVSDLKKLNNKTINSLLD